MKYISIADQLRTERANTLILKEQAEQNTADIDYIAMMCDVDLDDNDEEMEVSENE